MHEGDEPGEGVVETWSSADSVGRIQLVTGESIRFGASACKFLPVVGARVRVDAFDKHPLGGRRARSVSLVDPADADRILDESHPLRGTVERDDWSAAFADEVDALGYLGILLREPITSRAHMRAWFARASAQVRFDDPRGPIVRAGDVEYRVLLCTRALPAGSGFLSFASLSPFPIERERELALQSAEIGGPRIDCLPALGALVDLVARCVAAEVAVCAHQAINHFVPAAQWPTLPTLAQWTAPVRHQDGQILFSGLRSLHLPDLYGPADVAEVIEDAARALVDLGRRPEAGELLGECEVTESGYSWVRVERA